jgi:putative addiction module antidote
MYQHMVELKVRKVGNSLGVVLPKDVTARLNAKEGTKLYLVEAPDGDYRLSQYDDEFGRRMEKAGDLMQRYRNTLRKLAQ